MPSFFFVFLLVYFYYCYDMSRILYHRYNIRTVYNLYTTGIIYRMYIIPTDQTNVCVMLRKYFGKNFLKLLDIV
jgi:hypothetical protein